MSSPPRELAAPGFGSLGLAESLVTAVTALGYEEPTPIQREAIPLILSGRDLLAQAATGTGNSVVPLYGGASISQQIRALQRGVDICVATPGRALDHLRRRSLDLQSV